MIFHGYYQEKDSEFIKYLVQKYRKIFHKEPNLKEEHFLLECAWFSKKIPNLQYVSISPNIENPHSPYERVSISSMQKMWEYIKEVSKDLDRNQIKLKNINKENLSR